MEKHKLKHLKEYAFSYPSFNEVPKPNFYFGEGEEGDHYMFHQNLKSMNKLINELLSKSKEEIDAVLSDGHDWAKDHLSSAMENIEQVHSFLLNREEDSDKGEEPKEETEPIDLQEPEDDEEGEDKDEE